MPTSPRTLWLSGRAAAGLAGLLVASIPGPAQADQVYRSVDAQGHVTYSDRPNSTAAQKTEVTVQQADPAEAARLAKEHQVLKAEDDLRKKQEWADGKAKAQQEHDKQTRCQAARDHYFSIKDARRLYKSDADGNRVFYTDAEADIQREQARQVMNTACGT